MTNPATTATERFEEAAKEHEDACASSIHHLADWFGRWNEGSKDDVPLRRLARAAIAEQAKSIAEKDAKIAELEAEQKRDRAGIDRLKLELATGTRFAPPKGHEHAKAFVKRKTDCIHHECWTTLSGDCMPCRVEQGENKIAELVKQLDTAKWCPCSFSHPAHDSCPGIPFSGLTFEAIANAERPLVHCFQSTL